MASKREGFFGTDNLHRAGWTAVVGLAGFTGAHLYQKVFGPAEVFVERPKELAEPRRVTTEVAPQSKDIVDLTVAIQRLAKDTSTKNDQDQLNELRSEVDRLRLEVAKTKLAAPSAASTAAGGSSLAALGVPHPPSAKAFELPSVVHGYTVAPIVGVSKATCPAAKIAAGSEITASFELNDETLFIRATPVRSTIVKVRSPVDLLQVTESWSNLRAGTNTVSLFPVLEPGSYRLTYGFYLRDAVAVEYPRFYAHECSFIVGG